MSSQVESGINRHPENLSTACAHIFRVASARAKGVEKHGKRMMLLMDKKHPKPCLFQTIFDKTCLEAFTRL